MEGNKIIFHLSKCTFTRIAQKSGAVRGYNNEGKRYKTYVELRLEQDYKAGKFDNC